MKIAMLTNTYLPHVGGVANSVKQFTDGYRQRGHEVLIVAPTYREDCSEDQEENVVRIPALKQIEESNFSLALPTTPKLSRAMQEFQPDLLHSHHPYIIGDTALRLSASDGVPLVFTYHTMYEHYTHYSPVAPDHLKDFIVELASGYANLCDVVIAPSQSTADILRERGVTTSIVVIPTGVDVDRFAGGDGKEIRDERGIPPEAPVVGYVGRLATEKNLGFLSRALSTYLERDDTAHALVVGDGGARSEMEDTFAENELSERLHMTGELTGQRVIDAYHAMDVFAFASLTETQGMALAEALAAGRPVVALEAPGAREITRDGENGQLVPEQDIESFADAVATWVEKTREDPEAVRRRCRDSVEEYRSERCVKRALELYGSLLEKERSSPSSSADGLEAMPEAIAREGKLWLNRLRALARAFVGETGDQ